MTPSQLMQALSDAGAPFEAILIAVRALEEKDEEIAARDAEAAEKRAKDAERKRISRASVDSPRTRRGQDGTAISVEAGLIEGFTPVSPKGDTAPKGSVRNRGSKISEDWTPPLVAELGPDFRRLAEQWTADSYRTEAAAFVSYWLGESGAKACKSNWKRAWENRVSQIHGKVMRDQRFAGPTTDSGSYLDLLAAKQARSASR